MSDKPKILGVTGGAVALSALALAFGACCVAPWAVGLLGVGGAVLLARLAGFQSPVVAVTFLLLGIGFWYAYRARSDAHTWMRVSSPAKVSTMVDSLGRTAASQ